ncbi:MAG: hypothetical protein F4018_12795 [Acidobacteria bacterium]|nr:hypothetical protein [Acidobacteriota bacterium]MYK89131.1 hypothetical protein [Acidobacteriota bacterium]
MQARLASTLRRRRTMLLRQLPSLKAILRGSLIERFKRCGRPGCKCARGIGHGPKLYLSVSVPKARPVMVYVPQEHRSQVEQFVANYRQTRKLLDEVAAINLELLRRREPID